MNIKTIISFFNNRKLQICSLKFWEFFIVAYVFNYIWNVKNLHTNTDCQILIYNILIACYVKLSTKNSLYLIFTR